MANEYIMWLQFFYVGVCAQKIFKNVLPLLQQNLSQGRFIMNPIMQPFH